MTADESLLWRVRAYIYRHFAENSHPPSAEETARHLKLEVRATEDIYWDLNERHAIFLDPETGSIRMANPFSAVQTNFRVICSGRTYYANCAWDMLGIPAALHSDATIQAICSETNEMVKLHVRHGQVSASDLRIHFPIPFSKWYEDLAYT
jgi:hypothetical protein